MTLSLLQNLELSSDRVESYASFGKKKEALAESVLFHRAFKDIDSDHAPLFALYGIFISNIVEDENIDFYESFLKNEVSAFSGKLTVTEVEFVARKVVSKERTARILNGSVQNKYESLILKMDVAFEAFADRHSDPDRCDNIQVLGDFYRAMATLERIAENYEKAERLILKSISITQEPFRLQSSFEITSAIYSYWGKFEQGASTFEKILHSSTKYPDVIIFDIYRYLNSFYSRLQQNYEALKCLKSAARYAVSMADKSRVCCQIGDEYNALGETELAQQYYEICLVVGSVEDRARSCFRIAHGSKNVDCRIRYFVIFLDLCYFIMNDYELRRLGDSSIYKEMMSLKKRATDTLREMTNSLGGGPLRLFSVFTDSLIRDEHQLIILDELK